MQRAALLVLLGLACAPPPTSEAQLPEDLARDVWVLVIHGSGDGPERWATGLIETLKPRITLGDRVAFVAYDWSAAAADKLAAANHGTWEGEAIARVVLERAPSHVHVIAHSAGAFVARGLEVALAGQPRRPTLHLTLLDPFLGLGLDFGWGQTRFGAEADFAESYLNRDDGVPGTEISVRAAHTFDVTNVAARAGGWPGKDGHWWPTAAYPLVDPGPASSLEVAGQFDAAALRARFPVGGITVLP